MKKIIKLIALSKRYSMQDYYALYDLSLKIKRGDFLGLIGPNGSGKTTTLSMITGLLKPTYGGVEIFGKKASKMKKIIGFAPQDIALYEQLTLCENLKIFGKLYKLRGKKLYHRIEDVLNTVELFDVKDKIVSKFSGGMKRRANIAVALLHKPEILVLDEPTVGIDPQSRNLILQALKRLNGEGVTIIYSTHYMEEVELLCSKVAILDDGRLVERGSIKKLLKRHKEVDNLGELFLKYTGRSVRNV